MLVFKRAGTLNKLIELADLVRESAVTLQEITLDWGRLSGMKIAPLGTEQGFAAESSAAGVLQLASSFGIPVSTTHTITSSIVGAGAARRISSVRWGIAVEIALSWILTLPATIALGWTFARLFQIL